jgi:hypothetical protein
MQVYVRLEAGKIVSVATGEGAGYHPIPLTLPDGVMFEVALMGYTLEGAQKKAEEIRQLHCEGGISVISDEEINALYDEQIAESSGPGFNAVKFGRRVLRAYNTGGSMATPATTGDKPVAVFDLDGTLADITHRRGLVEGPNKDWEAFFSQCDQDRPNKPVIEMAQRLAMSHEIHVVSARREKETAVTKTWMQDQGIPYSALWMLRPDEGEDKYTPDVELKQQWFDQFANRGRIAYVFDDRDKVVAMWRRNGLTCFQVAEGNF